MKKKRNAVILWKKRNNYGKNVMVGTSEHITVSFFTKWIFGAKGGFPQLHVNETVKMKAVTAAHGR